MADLKSVLVACFLVGAGAILFTSSSSEAATTSNSTKSTTSTTPASTTPTSTTPGTTPSLEEQCAKNNGSCEKCVSNSKCLYCKSNEKCMKYPIGEVIPKSAECSLSDARWGVCWVNFEALLIAVGVIGGVILISFAVCVYCCCCRSKGKSSKYAKEDAKYEQQKMERRERQEDRRNERKTRLDEIRRKYGLVKEDAPYSRFES